MSRENAITEEEDEEEEKNELAKFVETPPRSKAHE